MAFLPAVVRAQYRGNYQIRLVFNDGAEGTISFRRWLKGPVFEPLRDLDNFRRFYLDGGAVAWPNGADIAPEALYAAISRKGNRAKSMGRRKSLPAPARRSAR